MRIAEIFYSIQGEGRLVGTPSVFIRTSGCNLRCVWCDTPYTSWEPEGEERSLDEILTQVKRHPAKHAVVTGGEPLLAHDIVELSHGLKRAGYHVTIETAATIFKPVSCDLMSMSPKLSNSRPAGKFAAMHEEHRLNFPVIRQFIEGYDYQLKFVVEEKKDFAEIEELLAELDQVDRARVLAMPQGRTKEELRQRALWIVELCKEHGFCYTPRLQIELWGNRRGT